MHRSPEPDTHDPSAPLLRRVGQLQAGAGGLMLLLNIVLNLPMLRLLAG